jgi:hypothetical protein
LNELIETGRLAVVRKRRVFRTTAKALADAGEIVITTTDDESELIF